VGTPPLFPEEFEVVIMIAVATEEMHGVGPTSDLKGLQGEPWLEPTLLGRREPTLSWNQLRSLTVGGYFESNGLINNSYPAMVLTVALFRNFDDRYSVNHLDDSEERSSCPYAFYGPSLPL
jgi:hypothetical protein